AGKGGGGDKHHAPARAHATTGHVGATPAAGAHAATQAHSGTQARVGTQARGGAAAATPPTTPARGRVAGGAIALAPPPAQLRFYVHARKIKPLPNLETITHRMAVRLVVTAKRQHVGWTVLAAVARYESDFGARAGALAARRLSGAQLGQ